jgi:hypothetical protein
VPTPIAGCRREHAVLLDDRGGGAHAFVGGSHPGGIELDAHGGGAGGVMVRRDEPGSGGPAPSSELAVEVELEVLAQLLRR